MTSRKTPRQALSAPLLDTLEEEIQELRVAYERYFLGIDRRPPERARAQVERRVRKMGIGAMGSTALRFRLDGLRGRFVTYSQHWKRVSRQIEEGTYVRIVAEAERRRRLAAFEARVARDQAKAKKEAEAREALERGNSGPPEQAAAPSQPEPKSAADPATGGSTTLAPPPLGPPSVGSRAKKVRARPGGIEIPNGRALYENYVRARKAAGQSTNGLSYSAMMQQIARQTSKIQAQHGGKVRFEVATKDGRVKLMAKVEKA